MPAKLNIVGRTFERLFAFESAGFRTFPNGRRVPQSWVRCSCGSDPFIILNTSLTSGHTRSCGCLQRELTILRSTTHGGTHTVEYAAWCNMIQRCTNPSATYFCNYGGRGIKICEGLRPFPKFMTVLGKCPEGLELDRWPDNETGHYSCGACEECTKNGWQINVRWATRRQQNQHRRNSRVFTVRGITQCLQAMSDHFGINRKTVTGRLELGWDVERAFTQPVSPKQRLL